MEKNDYLYGMLKSEEHTVEVLTSDLHEERRRRHAAEKGKRDAERRAEMSERKADALQSQLTAKMDELSSLMQQLVQFMMGNGAVSLSESLKESVIAVSVLSMKEEKPRFVSLTNFNWLLFVMKTMPSRIRMVRILLLAVLLHKKLAKEGKEEMVNLLANRWQPGLLLAKLNY